MCVCVLIRSERSNKEYQLVVELTVAQIIHLLYTSKNQLEHIIEKVYFIITPEIMV